MPKLSSVKIILALVGGLVATISFQHLTGAHARYQSTTPAATSAPTQVPIQPVPLPPQPTPVPLQPPLSPNALPAPAAASRAAAVAPVPAPSQTPAQPAPPTPAPSQAPSQPAPAPAKPGPFLRPEFLILPGDGIGPFRIGMRLEYLEGRLGANKGVQQFSDGTSVYRWFEPPANAGIAARISDAGVVQRVWVLNDQRYATKEGLRIGSTEAQVRSVLGPANEVEEDQQQKTRTLRYYDAGIWFIIQLDDRFTFHNAVYDIGVMLPR